VPLLCCPPALLPALPRPAPRAQKKAEREAMLRSQFEEKRAERVQKYQVGLGRKYSPSVELETGRNLVSHGVSGGSCWLSSLSMQCVD
jgi:hypothetical protein